MGRQPAPGPSPRTPATTEVGEVTPEVARRAAAGRWLLPAAATGLVALCLGLQGRTGRLLALGGAFEAWAAVTVAITLQALPFLVLGVLVSALVAALVPQSLLRRLTPRDQRLAVPAAAACGTLLPGCECASVPVAQSLIRQGLPPAAAYAFLLASPAVNPVVLVSTAVAFPGNPAMVWARLLASLLAAVLVGWVWIILGRGQGGGQGLHHTHGGASRAEVFRAAAVHDLMGAGGYLAAGAMAAALIKVAAPRSWLSVLGQNPAVAVLVLAGLAVLLSLCSEADAFVAASFVGVHPTVQLAFLVVGPMVDLKLVAMQYGAWGRGFVLRFVPLTLAVAVACASAVGALLLSWP